MSTLTIQTLTEKERKYAVEFNSIVEEKNLSDEWINVKALEYWMQKCFLVDYKGMPIYESDDFEHCPKPYILEKCALEYKRDCMS